MHSFSNRRRWTNLKRMVVRWAGLSCLLVCLAALGCSQPKPDPILGQWTLDSTADVPLALKPVASGVYIHFFENGKCIFGVPVPLTKKEITVKGTWKPGDQDNVRIAEFSEKDDKRQVEVTLLDADTIELIPPTKIKVPVKFARTPTSGKK